MDPLGTTTALTVYNPQREGDNTPESRLKAVLGEIFRDSTTTEPSLNPAFQVSPEARMRRICTVLPPLSGQHSVGYKTFVIEGPKSTRSVGDTHIGIEVYSPTENSSGSRPLIPVPIGVYIDETSGIDLATNLSEEQIQTLQTHSLDGVTTSEKRPVIMFSHGMGVPPVGYRILLEELASHGYTVLCLNHPSTSCDDPLTHDRSYSEGLIKERMEEKDPSHLATLQADNIQYVVDKIQRNELREVFTDLNPVDQIILAGHSLGGAASVIVAARKDPLIAGCINLDGGLLGDKSVIQEGLSVPLFTCWNDSGLLKEGDEFYEEEVQVLRDRDELHHNSTNAHIEKIPESYHADFQAVDFILGWLMGGVEDSSLDAVLKVHEVTSRKIEEFIKTKCEIFS